MALTTRDLQPEVMDDPHLGRGQHFQALRGLERINRWTRNAKLAWRPLRELARSTGRDRLSVLDIGTGAGDVPIGLCRYAARSGISLEIDACDVSSQALEFARNKIEPAGLPINLFPLDVLKEPVPRRYDLVMCATFLHHFTETQAVGILEKMRAAARHRVVVVDLIRSRLNWFQVWVATRLFSRSKVVHFDGPQSILAAFTPAEICGLAEQAGLENLEIRRSWPCRFVLVGECDR